MTRAEQIKKMLKAVAAAEEPELSLAQRLDALSKDEAAEKPKLSLAQRLAALKSYEPCTLWSTESGYSSRVPTCRRTCRHSVPDDGDGDGDGDRDSAFPLLAQVARGRAAEEPNSFDNDLGWPPSRPASVSDSDMPDPALLAELAELDGGTAAPTVAEQLQGKLQELRQVQREALTKKRGGDVEGVKACMLALRRLHQEAAGLQSADDQKQERLDKAAAKQLAGFWDAACDAMWAQAPKDSRGRISLQVFLHAAETMERAAAQATTQAMALPRAALSQLAVPTHPATPRPRETIVWDFDYWSPSLAPS